MVKTYFLTIFRRLETPIDHAGIQVFLKQPCHTPVILMVHGYATQVACLYKTKCGGVMAVAVYGCAMIPMAEHLPMQQQKNTF